MQDVPADKTKRMPSSRVLEEVIHQAPAEYVTVGWLTSTLHQHSFGIIMLSLGLLAMTPVGSTVPGLILAVMAVQLIAGRGEPVFPHFIMTRRLPTKQLLRLAGRAIRVLKYLEKAVHPRWPMTFEAAKRAIGVALPLPKPKTHFDLAGALAEGFLGGAFAGAAGLRGAALPAGRLLIDLIRRDVDLTMQSTDSVAPGRNDHGRRCRRKPGNLRAAKGFPVTG